LKKDANVSTISKFIFYPERVKASHNVYINNKISSVDLTRTGKSYSCKLFRSCSFTVLMKTSTGKSPKPIFRPARGLANTSLKILKIL
jgi:hypothetical protein